MSNEMSFVEKSIVAMLEDALSCKTMYRRTVEQLVREIKRGDHLRYLAKRKKTAAEAVLQEVA